MVKRTITYLFIAATLSITIQQPIQAKYTAAKALAALAAYHIMSPYVENFMGSRAHKKVTKAREELISAKEIGTVPPSLIQAREKALIEAIKKHNYWTKPSKDRLVAATVSKLFGLGLGALSLVALGAEALLLPSAPSSTQSPQYTTAKVLALLAVPSFINDWIKRNRAINIRTLYETINDAKKENLSAESINSLEQDLEKAAQKKTAADASSWNYVFNVSHMCTYAAAVAFGAEALFS